MFQDQTCASPNRPGGKEWSDGSLMGLSWLLPCKTGWDSYKNTYGSRYTQCGETYIHKIYIQHLKIQTMYT